MNETQLIKRTFIGRQLSDDEIEIALNNSNFTMKQFDKGNFLHLEDEECISLEILLVGDIVSMHIDEYGTVRIIHIYEYNEIVGGNILFGTSPKYPLSFFAKSQGVLLQINKTFLFDLFIKRPNILRQFLTLTADRAISLIKLAKRKPLRSSIMEYLHAQSLFQNSSAIILPISKSELAARFGVQRTSVSREFSRMEKDGLIKIYNIRTIEIVK